MEQAHGIGAAADAGDQRIRQAAFGVLHLLARLAADDALEIAHHGGIRMRAGDRADAIKRVGDVGDPVAQRLVHSVFERLEPDSTARTSAPSIFILSTLGFCRSTSTAPM